MRLVIIDGCDITTSESLLILGHGVDVSQALLLLSICGMTPEMSDCHSSSAPAEHRRRKSKVFQGYIGSWRLR